MPANDRVRPQKAANADYCGKHQGAARRGQIFLPHNGTNCTDECPDAYDAQEDHLRPSAHGRKAYRVLFSMPSQMHSLAKRGGRSWYIENHHAVKSA